MEPIVGRPVRIPPGRVEVRLGPEHRMAYRRLYGRYKTVTAGLPVLRERDFDGRRVLLTPAQLEALNRALAESGPPTSGSAPFGRQEAAKTGLAKRTQYLS